MNTQKMFVPRLMLIASTVLLMLFGLLMVFSASSVEGLTKSNLTAEGIFIDQLKWVAISLILLVASTRVSYGIINEKFVVVIWLAMCTLLVLVLVNGVAVNGSKRWIFGFQPAEFAKIAVCLATMFFIMRLHNRKSSAPLIVIGLSAIIIPVLLISVEPDLGTTIIMLVGVLAVMWFAEVPIKWIILYVALLVFFALIMIVAMPYRLARLMIFLNPNSDPLGAGYHIINSTYSFADGGLFGVGLGLSRQKFSYLPEAQNDFIFAIVGEELGLIGALFVLVLFAVFLVAGFWIARRATCMEGRVIAGASTSLIVFQAFLNILCSLGWAPVTGKTLPFISAGGSSLIASSILVGLIISVSLYQPKEQAAAKRRDDLLIIEGGAQRSSARTKTQADVVSASSQGRRQKKAPAAGGARSPQPQHMSQQRRAPEHQKRAGQHQQRIPKQPQPQRIARYDNDKVVAINRRRRTQENTTTRDTRKQARHR